MREKEAAATRNLSEIANENLQNKRALQDLRENLKTVCDSAHRCVIFVPETVVIGRRDVLRQGIEASEMNANFASLYVCRKRP